MATRGHPSWNALRHLKGYRWRPPRRWLLAAMPPKPTLMIALPWTWWVGASMARFCNIHVLVSLSISPFASIISWVLYIYIYHIDCRCIYCIYIYILFFCFTVIYSCWSVDVWIWSHGCRQATHQPPELKAQGMCWISFCPEKKNTQQCYRLMNIATLPLNFFGTHAEYHIFCSADEPCTLRMGEFSESSVHCQGADRVTDPEAPLVEWKRLQTIVALTCRSKL